MLIIRTPQKLHTTYNAHEDYMCVTITIIVIIIYHLLFI
jgi:hypothetical protein